MFLHIKHHSSSGNEQNPKNLFFRALKKNPFLEKLFLSKTQKILRFEKNHWWQIFSTSNSAEFGICVQLVALVEF